MGKIIQGEEASDLRVGVEWVLQADGCVLEKRRVGH